MNIATQLLEIAKSAKKAAATLALAGSEQKKSAILAAATAIEKNAGKILTANKIDMDNAKKSGISGALLDRLELNESRVKSMADGLRQVANQPDPVGKILAEWVRPNGLKIARVSVPLGVIGVIYESRPNVTADAAGLSIKSGNVAILRCGSESFESSSAIMECLQTGLKSAGLAPDSVQLIPTRDRTAVGEMLKLDEYIDIIVPRGGKELIKRVLAESRIPVIKHLEGNCHTYIHASADVAKAVKITVNAKMRRCGVCGATESLLVDEKIAAKFVPLIAKELTDLHCEIRGDEKSRSLDSRIVPANEEDWDTEYLDAIISLKIVKNLDEAITHINRHGSHHTDAIITEDDSAAEKFLTEIDSAIVIHNASTQFADGGEFGMGAEIGISTGKLHARGPVGAEQLTTYKYVVRGKDQIRP